MRALFLGLGGVGQRHLRNLRQLRPGTELAAVRHVGRAFEIGPTLQADHGVDIVEKYGIRLFPDIEQAAAAFAPDFAVVSSPTSAHAGQAIRLMRAGIPVLLEKPACADDAELDALLAVQAETKVAVAVAYMLRANPSVRRLLELVAARRIGRLYAVEAVANSFMPSWHPYEGYNTFYAGRRDLGGGAILTEVHLCDLLHTMLGLPRRLWCVGGQLSPFALDVEDSVTALMEYQTEGRPLPVTLTVSFVQRPVRFGITLKGEHGTIEWDLLTTSVTVEDATTGTREAFTAPTFERNTMFVDEMRAFLDGLDSGRLETALPLVAGGQRMALAMKRSLEGATPVEVTP